MDASAHFRGKKITVMGLGVLGRGVGDVTYLANCGAELIVTDLKPEAELADSLAVLKGLTITYTLGEHKLEDFQGRDLILKAAGVPLDSPYVAEAEKNNIPVRMSADLFVEYASIPVIGVTGTRGKSTVTHMIAEILEAAGKEILLGGNIRGISTLALLSRVQGNEIAVLELDSWQLQGFRDAHRSPHIAVFTTFYPDHLNYYGGNMDAYLRDKANIFLNQHEDDILILGAQCAAEIQEKYQKQFKGKFEVWGAHDFPQDWNLHIPGEHNRYNAALALAVARALKMSDGVTRGALESFRGVPGRLELVRETRGLKIYNDSNSTTPEATIAALTAIDPDEKKNIVLIMGGADKNLDMNALLVEIPKHTKRVILLSGSGTSRVLEFLPGASVFDSLVGALHEASTATTAGDVILFSPAFASFGMFRNEYDRSDQFNALIQKI